MATAAGVCACLCTALTLVYESYIDDERIFICRLLFGQVISGGSSFNPVGIGIHIPIYEYRILE